MTKWRCKSSPRPQLQPYNSSPLIWLLYSFSPVCPSSCSLFSSIFCVSFFFFWSAWQLFSPRVYSSNAQVAQYLEPTVTLEPMKIFYLIIRRKKINFRSKENFNIYNSNLFIFMTIQFKNIWNLERQNNQSSLKSNYGPTLSYVVYKLNVNTDGVKWGAEPSGCQATCWSQVTLIGEPSIWLSDKGWAFFSEAIIITNPWFLEKYPWS